MKLLFHRLMPPTVFLGLFAASILLAYFVVPTVTPASAAPPTTMNFQGRLADSTGSLMPDGLYNMQFRLFTVASGGSATWTETRETTNRVQVTNGLFSVQLGAVTPITASLFSGSDVYFEITMPTPGTATCATASCASWESAMTPRHKMATSAYAFQAENANMLDGLDSTAFAAATGSANYIQNGTSPQTANFNITGTGTAATLQAATLDRATAGALTIGGTNASSITLSDNTTVNANLTVSAGNSLTLAGGNTASRPGSPAEGMVYFDSETDKLLTYSNGKWQADRTDAVLVAASNSSQSDKDAADYVADGNTGAALDGDQVQINSALTAASGKKVVLLAGTYTVDASVSVPNNTTLSGVGTGTILTIPNSFNAALNVITNSDTSTGTGMAIRDMKIDGNKSNQSSGSMTGVYLNGVGDVDVSRKGGVVTGLSVSNMRGTGIVLLGSSGNSVDTNQSDTNSTGYFVGAGSSANTLANNVASTNSTGYYVGAGSSANTLANNVASENTYSNFTISGSSKNTLSANTSYATTAAYGYYLSTATQNNLTDNTSIGADIGISVETASDGNTITSNRAEDAVNYGIALWGSSKNTISDNSVTDSGGLTINSGIRVQVSDFNQVTNNNINDASCTTTCYAIDISDVGSDMNYLSGNTFTGDGTYAATIRDIGTGTRYVGQTKTEGGLDVLYKQTNSASALQVQNATGVAQLTADTTNSRIQIGSTTTDATAIVFALDNYNQATDPTGVNGAMYYNTNLNKFRCYQGAWADCITTAGAATNLSNLTTTAINQTLTPNANNTLDIGMAGTAWRTGYFATSLNTPALRPMADSTTALLIQNAAGSTTILTVNTSANSVLVGSGANGVSMSANGIVYTGTARTNKTISLSPEYAGATFIGDGTDNLGSLSSDFCSGSSRQGINTSACDTTDTHNYYQWTTTETTVQDYDIYVRYQMPSDYDTGSMANMRIWGWGTTSAAEIVTISLISDASATPCSTSSNAIASNATWAQATVGSPLGGCTPAAGDWVTFKVRVAADEDYFARAGAISFEYRGVN